MEKIAFTRKEAVEATGYSEDTLRRAINAGDLQEHAPQIDGRHVAKKVILRSELERWLTNEVRN